MLLFRRATNKSANLILAGGFQDRTGSYMMDCELTGVWLSADEALDENSGARGDVVLTVEIPEN